MEWCAGCFLLSRLPGAGWPYPRPRCEPRRASEWACQYRVVAHRSAPPALCHPALLKKSDQFVSVMLVFYLNDDLCIVQLLQFRRDREPERWPAATDKNVER